MMANAGDDIGASAHHRFTAQIVTIEVPRAARASVNASYFCDGNRLCFVIFRVVAQARLQRRIGTMEPRRRARRSSASV